MIKSETNSNWIWVGLEPLVVTIENIRTRCRTRIIENKNGKGEKMITREKEGGEEKRWLLLLRRRRIDLPSSSFYFLLDSSVTTFLLLSFYFVFYFIKFSWILKSISEGLRCLWKDLDFRGHLRRHLHTQTKFIFLKHYFFLFTEIFPLYFYNIF